MKLPFNTLLSPLIKPQLGKTRTICRHPAFEISTFYTYFYGVLGFLISAIHFKQHLGELPPAFSQGQTESNTRNFMIYHDLKIISTSMALVQYICLLAGCYSKNPSLFLPHLFGQIVVITIKLIQILLILTTLDSKMLKRLIYSIPSVMLLMFNWSQEFCVFRKYLCICDL